MLIGLGALLAVALVIPADLEFLAAIYAFGATLAFTLVHLSVIRLRFREPDRDRPYKMPFNVRVGRGELPLTAVARRGDVGASRSSPCSSLHDAARFVGVGWMPFGVALYVTTGRSRASRSSSASRCPAKALTRQRGRGGVRLDPRAGARHAARRRHHADRRAARRRGERGRRRGRRGDRGAVGVRGADGAAARRARARRELSRARKALARAKAVGEEYEGVEVATATVRARRAGEAIVREARRRGVEAIVLAAEEPTGMRGGVLLGGKQGLRDSFVGRDDALRGAEGAAAG